MEQSEFLVQVMNEIEHIKKVATVDEISKLDFAKFDHAHFSACIYGQMTGSCHSDRATELHPKIYAYIDEHDWEQAYTPFYEQNFELGIHFTSLEKYLFMVKAPIHKEIIDYIKGETTSLNLI